MDRTSHLSLPPLVIGIGNTLMGDDGVGPYVISLLGKTKNLNADLTVLDTPGYALMTYFSGRNKVIIVDAASFDAPAGSVVRLTKEGIGPKGHSGLSLHDADPFVVAEYAEMLGLAPREIVVYAIRFERIAPSENLSQAVKEGAEKAAVLIAREISSNA